MKISYLFGAGASKQCLPIVNEIPDRIENVISIIEKKEFQLSDSEIFDGINLETKKQEVQGILIDDLKWLVRETKDHASIDTFAKKLFVKRKTEDLGRLKAAFSVYLIIEQIINKPDKRYDSFYASILNRDYRAFPENLRILSWNYDSQFEISFSGYTDQNSLETNRSFLNIILKYSYNTPDNSRFSLLKLNGSTNLYHYNGFESSNYINEFPISLSLEDLDLIIRSFAAIRSIRPRFFSGLSFAWERSDKSKDDIVLHAKNETKDTEVLVVIGYSFPYFNREIDREIIRSMDSLKKVYFQAPDANILRERFLSVREDIKLEMLLTRFDLDQFILPNEL